VSGVGCQENGRAQCPRARRTAAGLGRMVVLFLVAGCRQTEVAPTASPPVEAAPAAVAEAKPAVEHGRLETIQGYRVLSLDGTPEQMGRACGTLLKPTIRKVVTAMITDGIGADRAEYESILNGSRVMERYQPEEYLRELKAMAAAADVRYEDLVLLQYFGDVRRSIGGKGSSFFCTAFAITRPNTREDTCIVGRNFDYFDHGVGDYASLLVYYRPEGKIPFVTVTWAGVINGWTLLNEKGIVTANDTAHGKTNSLAGISTCFLLRHIAENAGTVSEGIALVKKSKRSCGTAVLVASGNPPDGAIVEFDAAEVAVRRLKNGFVGADNRFDKLYDPGPRLWGGRLGEARDLVKKHSGGITLATEIADADGVPIDGMNLHCVTVDAGKLIMRVAMGGIPAYKRPFKTFRLTEKGLVSVE